jgi:2-polyprenyl-6-methoxyphenol hydroxylase-like FAD-dependent oxidoreductase
VPEPRIIIVGAGPSGAATALALAGVGHEVTVLDRAEFPRDKACGEGLMPPGVAVLRRLGLLDAVLVTGAVRLDGVTYQHEGDGPSVFAHFPLPRDLSPRWGLGVRRLSFDAALASAIRDNPRVTFLEGVRVDGILRHDRRVVGVRTTDGLLESDVVVAADGLHSRLRNSAGWGRTTRGRHRYGMVGHWRVDTRTHRGITVSFAREHEWYQAPVSTQELLVSSLGSRTHMSGIAHDYAAAARAAIPALHDAELTSSPLAAGNFRVRARPVARDGLFLVGDAAGYDDPTTGEGIGVGLQLGESLAGHLDRALRGTMTLDAAAAAYSIDHDRLWRNRRRITALALFMAAHPSLSRRAVSKAGSRPHTLSRLLGINCGYHGFARLTPLDWLTFAGL